MSLLVSQDTLLTCYRLIFVCIIMENIESTSADAQKQDMTDDILQINHKALESSLSASMSGEDSKRSKAFLRKKRAKMLIEATNQVDRPLLPPPPEKKGLT